MYKTKVHLIKCNDIQIAFYCLQTMTDEDTRENEKDTHLRVYLEFDNSYESKKPKFLHNCFINVRNKFS